MIASFKNFIQNETDKFSLFIEEEGVSTTKMEFPITQPLANLLSLMPSNTLKADALNWIFTEGLMEASKGREELLEQVRKEMQKPRNLNFPPKNIPSRVAMQSEMAREVMHRSDEDIKSQDLFSREARERLPILETMKIDGKSITDYYEENYEPKFMRIEYEQSKFGEILIDLQELNKNLESLGLKPFKYGGLDGYIQHVEKGDYLGDDEKRSVLSANNQHGLDLRPEKKIDKETGKEVNVDDLKGSNKKDTGDVYNFMGGSTAKDLDRAKNTISVLRSRFANIMSKIDDPNHKTWEELKKQGIVQQVKSYEDSGREKVFKKLGLDEGNLPEFMSKEDFEFIIHNGLAEIQEGKWENYKNIGVSSDMGGAGFKDLTETGKSKDELEEGQYLVIKDEIVYYKFTEKQMEDILEKLRKSYPKILLRINFSGTSLENMITVKRFGGSYVIANDNMKIVIETQFNKGYNFLKDYPDEHAKEVIQKIKDELKNIHTYANKDYHKFIFDKAVEKIEVDPSNTEDPTIKELMKNDFKWDEKKLTDEEKKEGKPLKKERSDYTLTNGKIEYHIVRKGKPTTVRKGETIINPNPFFLIFPLHGKGSGFNPESYGDLGRAMLASDNYLFNAGEMGQHLKQNPLSKKDYDEFEKDLNNKLAANKIYDPTEAPFAKAALSRAANDFITNHTEFKINKNKKEEQINDYKSSVWASMKAFSGDRAFHVGFLDSEELSDYEIEERSIPLKDELIKITNNESFVNYIINWLKKAPFKGISIDWSDLENKIKEKIGNKTEVILNKIKQAVEVNANEGRTRLMSKFLLSMMERDYKGESKHKAQSTTGKDGSADKDLSDSDKNRAGFGNSGMWMPNPKSHQEIAELLGIDLNAKGVPYFHKNAPKIPKSAPAKKSTIEDVKKLWSTAPDLSPRIAPPVVAPPRIAPPVVAPPVVAPPAIAPPVVAPPVVAPPAIAPTKKSTIEDVKKLWGVAPPAKIAPTAVNPTKKSTIEDVKKLWENESNNGNLFKDYNNWRSLREMAGSFAVSTNKKPKDGDGWNWWGAKGDKSGISISGEVDDVKTNPTGKKNAKKR